MFESREFKTFLGSRLIVFADPCLKSLMVKCVPPETHQDVNSSLRFT